MNKITKYAVILVVCILLIGLVADTAVAKTGHAKIKHKAHHSSGVVHHHSHFDDTRNFVNGNPDRYAVHKIDKTKD